MSDENSSSNDEFDDFESNEEIQPPAEQKSSKKPAIFIAAGAAVVLGVGAIFLSQLGPTPLERAVEACGLESDFAVSLDEGGGALFIEGEGNESSGLDVTETLCILRDLEVTDSVISRMSNTSSLNGQQEGSWNGITALWTYHPDNGLDIFLELD